MAAVIACKGPVANRAVRGLADWLAGMPNMTVLIGAARFTGTRIVAVADRVPRAPQMLPNANRVRSSRRRCTTWQRLVVPWNPA